MKSYSGFAEIYDTLMDDFDYPKWAKYYMQLFAQIGIVPQRLCECACGTGSLTIEFAHCVKEIIGVDLSAEMLEQAAKKSRQNGISNRYICQDMRKLHLPGKWDCVVCACDGINYLVKDADVLAFFKQVNAILKDGGGLAFDISSPYKMIHMLGDAFFGEERDQIAYLWQNTHSGDCIDMDLTFFVEEESGLYRKITEKHRQRIHYPDNLVRMLSEAGFGDIHIYGDMNFDVPKQDELRIHFVAKKEKQV